MVLCNMFQNLQKINTSVNSMKSLTLLSHNSNRFDQPGIKHCITIEKCLLDPDGQDIDLNLLNEYPNINLDSLRIELKMFQLMHQFSTVVDAATILSSLTPESRGIFREFEKLV